MEVGTKFTPPRIEGLRSVNPVLTNEQRGATGTMALGYRKCIKTKNSFLIGQLTYSPPRRWV